MVGQLKIKKFNLDNINTNPIIIMIAKRPSGRSWLYSDYKDNFDIKFELRIGNKNVRKK
jgi:hypothetical protein